MPPSTGSVKYIEGLRLTNEERDAILEQMSQGSASDRRKSPRIIVEGNFALLLTLQPPGSAPTHFKIYPWDVSRGGVGFFHRSFVHPGTPCTFGGLDASGRQFSVKATVARCGHVSGNVHMIGTRLLKEIDPAVLLGSAAVAKARELSGARPDDWWASVGALAATLCTMAADRTAANVIRQQAARLMECLSVDPVIAKAPNPPLALSEQLPTAASSAALPAPSAPAEVLSKAA